MFKIDFSREVCFLLLFSLFAEYFRPVFLLDCLRYLCPSYSSSHDLVSSRGPHYQCDMACSQLKRLGWGTVHITLACACACGACFWTPIDVARSSALWAARSLGKWSWAVLTLAKHEPMSKSASSILQWLLSHFLLPVPTSLSDGLWPRCVNQNKPKPRTNQTRNQPPNPPFLKSLLVMAFVARTLIFVCIQSTGTQPFNIGVLSLGCFVLS